MAKVRCQRIGCDAFFSEGENPEDSCRYHDAGPIFHDGMKEWSCCKKRSHDFSEFLAIPGCKTGKHTSEKPSTKAVTASRTRTPAVTPSPGISTSTKESCSRCRQGFFCSDHGLFTKQVSAAPVIVPSPEDKDVQGSSLPQKKVIDINEPQTCKNKGCGETFKEKDNHASACNYHPGPAIFHDRMRGWKCCDVHVKEFDEFMEIPPCAKGWHRNDMIPTPSHKTEFKEYVLGSKEFSPVVKTLLPQNLIKTIHQLNMIEDYSFTGLFDLGMSET